MEISLVLRFPYTVLEAMTMGRAFAMVAHMDKENFAILNNL